MVLSSQAANDSCVNLWCLAKTHRALNSTSSSLTLERRLAAVTEIAQTMVSGLDYELILATVIEKVARLLDATSGGFMLYDASTQELRLQKPAFGLERDDLIELYRVPVAAGGNAASVFVTGQPYMTNDARNDPKLLKPFAELYNADRVLTVPLKIEGRAIGVYHAINKRSSDFSSEDVALLSLLAPHLAIVIQAAEMLRGLRSHEEQIERIIQQHNALVAMVLTRGSLEELAIRLSELVALPVFAAEWGGSIYTGRVMEPEQRTEVTSELEVMLARMAADPRNDMEPRLASAAGGHVVAVPVAAGPELLGVVAALTETRIIDDVLVRTLQQAALVFALAIMKEREIREVEQSLQTTIVERLFLAEHVEDRKHLLQRLGIPLNATLRIAHVVAMSSNAAGPGSLPHIPQRRTALTRALSQHWRGAVAFERDGGMHMILPCLPGTPTDVEVTRLQAVLHDITRGAPNSETLNWLIAVGGSAEQAGQLRQSDEQAHVAASVARALEPSPSVLFYENLGVYRLLAQPVVAKDVDDFVRRVLGPLADHDIRRGSDWLTFLEVLSDCNFSPKTAARRLHIHYNTAKYRTARISALIGRDFDSARCRLEIQLALDVLRTRAIIDRGKGLSPAKVMGVTSQVGSQQSEPEMRIGVAVGLQRRKSRAAPSKD